MLKDPPSADLFFLELCLQLTYTINMKRIDSLILFLKRLGVLLVVLTMLLLPLLVGSFDSVNAQGLTLPCDLNDPNCEPPQLRELQYVVIRFIYAAWAFGGIVFMLLLVVIGFIYLTSAGDEQKAEQAKKRGGQWVIGVLLYFLSQPVVATIMRGLISNEAECYANLRDPGFTFFFSTVCSETGSQNQGDDSVAPTGATATPTSSLISSVSDGVGGCCDIGSAAGSSNGCYGTDGGLPPETCTVSNVACQSGLSCAPSEVNVFPEDYGIPNSPCVEEGREYKFNLPNGTTRRYKCTAHPVNTGDFWWTLI